MKKLKPDWMSTDGWNLFKDKYLFGCDTTFDQWRRIAVVLARHSPDPDYWVGKFYENMASGKFSPSTPCLANTGTNRGLPVSCSGNYVGDSILDFFNARKENALLAKYGHGTSSFLGDIRPRGSKISNGGTASGSITELIAQRGIAQEISQGMTRRGSWAGYIPIDHGDFYEWWNFLSKYPDDTNIGWNVGDEFVHRLQMGEEEANKRWMLVLYLRAKYGRGYIFFPDKVARRAPEWMKNSGYRVHASNLCTEITLPSSDKYTFSCVLGSINLPLIDSQRGLSGVVFDSIVLLDCLVSEYLELIENKEGFDKIYEFTKDFRALGLGVIGFHSLLQMEGVNLDSMNAHYKNIMIFRTIKESSDEATKFLAEKLGTPELMKNLGSGPIRNSHRTAMMPTVSTSEIMGGWSEGINPMITNVASKTLTNGERLYVNPVLKTYLESEGLYTEENCTKIGKNMGSLKGLGIVSEEYEKLFRTAFEYSQKDLLRLASTRQPFICQAQSINLHFSKSEKENVISDIHRDAVLDESCLSLYYMRSSDGEPVGNIPCELCQ